MRLLLLIFWLFEVSYCNQVLQIPGLVKKGLNGNDQFSLDYGVLQRSLKSILGCDIVNPYNGKPPVCLACQPPQSQPSRNPIYNQRPRISPCENVFQNLKDQNDKVTQQTAPNNDYDNGEGESSDTPDNCNQNQGFLTIPEISRQQRILQNQQKDLIKQNMQVKLLLERNCQRQIRLQQQLRQLELGQSKQPIQPIQDQQRRQQILEQQRLEQCQIEEQRRQQQLLEQQRLEQFQIEEQRRQQQLLEQQRLEQCQIEEQRRQQQLLEQRRLEQFQIEEQRRQQQLLQQRQREQQHIQEQRRRQQLLEQRQREQQQIQEQRRRQQILEQQRIEQQQIQEQRRQQQLLEQQRLEQCQIEEQRRQQQLLEQQRIEQQQIQEQRRRQLIEQQQCEQQQIEDQRRQQITEQRQRHFEHPQREGCDQSPALYPQTQSDPRSGRCEQDENGRENVETGQEPGAPQHSSGNTPAVQQSYGYATDPESRGFPHYSNADQQGDDGVSCRNAISQIFSRLALNPPIGDEQSPSAPVEEAVDEKPVAQEPTPICGRRVHVGGIRVVPTN